MKSVGILVIGLCLIATISVWASTNINNSITLEQQGAFEDIAQLEKGESAVPVMVDVALKFKNNINDQVIVLDNNNIITPSTVRDKLMKTGLRLMVTDSFRSYNAGNMVDGNNSTFTEFPFEEGRGVYEIIESDTDIRNSVNGGREVRTSEERYSGNEGVDKQKQNKVIIDIKSDRLFRSSSVQINLDNNIDKPTRVRIVAIKADGSEQILLPERFFSSSNIIFPEANTNHYRITLLYIKPLRISEIRFSEKNAPQAVDKFVRFIAQPDVKYDIYYNTKSGVAVDYGETPNFSNNKNIKILAVDTIKKNELYKRADADKDGVIDKLDNCVNTPNPNQEDKDKNKIGDACEDFDYDGILNLEDNCISVANRFQRDEDFDGIGDKCDEEESRFAEKYHFVLYIILAIVFSVVIGLMIKTFKQK